MGVFNGKKEEGILLLNSFETTFALRCPQANKHNEYSQADPKLILCITVSCLANYWGKWTLSL